MDRVRMAVAGTGTSAREFLTACKGAGIAVRGIWSSEYTSLQQGRLAKEFGLQRSYSKFDELSGDEEITCVYFSVMGERYHDYIRQSLQAGKDVIIDPDFTGCYEEARKLYELAEVNRRFVFEPFVYQEIQVWERLKQAVKQIGGIRLVQVTTNLLSVQVTESDMKEQQKGPARVARNGLLKLNLQNTLFLVGLFGSPMSLSYHANKDQGMDTSGVMVLTYPGFIATSIASSDSLGINYFTIQGSQGFIRSPESPYSLHGFDKVMVDGTEHIVPLDPGRDKLESELRLYRTMVKEENFQLMAQRHKLKLDALDLLDQARLQVGMDIPKTPAEILNP